jgi:hypothetical protein
MNLGQDMAGVVQSGLSYLQSKTERSKLRVRKLEIDCDDFLSHYLYLFIYLINPQ